MDKSTRICRGICIAAGIIAVTLATIKGYTWDLHGEYAGPGSEYERTMEVSRDQRNSDCRDRVKEGSTDPKDLEGSRDFGRDHEA